MSDPTHEEDLEAASPQSMSLEELRKDAKGFILPGPPDTEPLPAGWNMQLEGAYQRFQRERAEIASRIVRPRKKRSDPPKGG